MIPCGTPKARVGRVGVWASPLIAAVLLLVFLFVLPVTPPAQGASQVSVLEQQVAQKLTEAEQTSSSLTALQSQMDTLQAAMSASADKLADVDVQMNGLQTDIDNTETNIASLRGDLEDRLVDIYKNGGSWSMEYLEALVAEKDLSSVLDRFDTLTTVAELDQQLFDQAEGYLEKSKSDKVALQKQQSDGQAAVDQLAASEQQLSAQQAQLTTQRQSLNSQIAGLNAQIALLKAQDAAAAAAEAARLKKLSDGSNGGSGSGSTTTSTTTKSTTPTTAPKTTTTAPKATTTTAPKATTTTTTAPSNPSAVPKPPTSQAEITAQANFIYVTFLKPRKSVLTGQMVMDAWIKHGITPAGGLAVLNAETGMGSTRDGGRLVTEANNFGCIRYKADPPWLSNWKPPISHGQITVGGRLWMTFPSVAEGMEAWARYIHYGLGNDRYRPLINTGNWQAFADIYYGKGVSGEATYIERLTWAYNTLKRLSAAAGYSW